MPKRAMPNDLRDAVGPMFWNVESRPLCIEAPFVQRAAICPTAQQHRGHLSLDVGLVSPFYKVVDFSMHRYHLMPIKGYAAPLAPKNQADSLKKLGPFYPPRAPLTNGKLRLPCGGAAARLMSAVPQVRQRSRRLFSCSTIMVGWSCVLLLKASTILFAF